MISTDDKCLVRMVCNLLLVSVLMDLFTNECLNELGLYLVFYRAGCLDGLLSTDDECMDDLLVCYILLMSV